MDHTSFATLINNTIDRHFEDAQNPQYDAFRNDLISGLLKQLEVQSKALSLGTVGLKPKVGPPQKSGTKTGSKSTYTRFISLLKYVGPGKKHMPELAGIKVKVEANFSDPSSKSAERFNKYKDNITHDNIPIEGQTLALGELYNAINNAVELDSLFGNAMARAAMIWGLTSETDHSEVISVADKHQLSS